MSHRKVSVTQTLLAILALVSSAGVLGDGPSIPAGRTLVVVGQAVEPPVTASMSDYVTGVGETPAGFMFYLILSGDLERTRSELATMAAFLDRYPGTVLQLGLGYGPELTQNVKESAMLLGGVFDAELDALGEWLKSRNHAVFLRPLYEFDRIGGTYGPPEVFKPAYRHVVDRLRNHELDNTAYVWHSAGPYVRSFDQSGVYGTLSVTQADALTEAYGTSPVEDLLPISAYYPGDGYVDYFATSYWGDGNAYTGRSSAAYREVIEQEVRRLLTEAQALGLPLMFGETTPWYIGTYSGAESVEWFDRYFQLIEEFDIRMTSLIVAEWKAEGGNWGNTNGAFPDDARIHPYPEIKARWLEAIAGPRYVDLADVRGCAGPRTAGDNFVVPGAGGPQSPAQGDLPGPQPGQPCTQPQRMNAFLGIDPEPVALPWSAQPEPIRDRLRWPNCPPPLTPGSGGWCLPATPFGP